MGSMRSVRAESCASRGAEKSRKPVTDAGPLVTGAVITRARLGADVQTTTGYTRLTQQDVRQALETLDDEGE
jgi:hypothetical protein